jgi:hypothetical protein
MLKNEYKILHHGVFPHIHQNTKCIKEEQSLDKIVEAMEASTECRKDQSSQSDFDTDHMYDRCIYVTYFSLFL